MNVTNNIPNYFEEDGSIGIEYLKINIEDNSDVPIKLSFPVAYEYLENAFNETNLLRRDKSLSSHALIDYIVVS